MNMVIPNEGKEKLLDWAIHDDGTGLEDYSLRLFKNNVPVANDSTLATFTQADFVGYANLSVTRAQMGSPAIVSNVAYRTRSSVPTFSCTGGSPQMVYGWILVSVLSGLVLAGQNFDTPRVMSSGATESIDPFKIGLQTLG